MVPDNIRDHILKNLYNLQCTIQIAQKLRPGEIFENKIIPNLKKFGTKFSDVRKVEQYWKEDVDLLLQNPKLLKLEIKTCMPHNRNMSFNNWVFKTQADYICYGIAQRNKIYIYPTAKMREALNKAGEEDFLVSKPDYKVINPDTFKVGDYVGLDNWPECKVISYSDLDTVSVADVVYELDGKLNPKFDAQAELDKIWMGNTSAPKNAAAVTVAKLQKIAADFNAIINELQYIVANN